MKNPNVPVWHHCKNILCVRADNMGDLLMSSPAIRALKETFQCKITVLTSAMGGTIAPFIPCIDEIMIHDLPWVKTTDPVCPEKFHSLIQELKEKNFDAAVIFTVYSQSPLPAALLLYAAGIQNVLAICRENPYQLLSHWLPETEPYQHIQHQVQRDLSLVNFVGATTNDDCIKIRYSHSAKKSMEEKCMSAGLNFNRPFIIFHPGVSENKRKYPVDLWVSGGRKITSETKLQIVVTGARTEVTEAKQLAEGIGQNALSVAGLLNIEEMIALIDASPLIVSVNTGTAHIAAATQTPVVVLYALTNPQHTPWKVRSSVLYFTVDEQVSSKNQVVSYVQQQLSSKPIPYPHPEAVSHAVKKMIGLQD